MNALFAQDIIPCKKVQGSVESLIRRLIKVGGRVSYHARKWHVHIATAFPLTRHYREAFDSG